MRASFFFNITHYASLVEAYNAGLHAIRSNK
jgi:hypothetical protein